MNLRRELRLTLGTLVVLNLILSFGAIGLLSRMSPAIEQILEENVYSIAAAEEVLAELAQMDGVATQRSRQRMRDALSRASGNVTEHEEAPALRAVRQHLPDALDGVASARRTVVESLQEFIAVNREAMRRTDSEAQRLGRAGAWAAVFVGFSTFALGLVIGIRLRSRILWPLVELSEVLVDVRRGYNQRRCRERNAPLEIREVTRAVNELLDERLARGHDAARPDEDLEHEALSTLLRREPRPAVVVDRDGTIFRANAAALARLSEQDGEHIREALRSLREPGPAEPGARENDGDDRPGGERAVTRLDGAGFPIDVLSLGGHGWLCVLGAETGSAGDGTRQ